MYRSIKMENANTIISIQARKRSEIFGLTKRCIAASANSKQDALKQCKKIILEYISLANSLAQLQQRIDGVKRLIEAIQRSINSNGSSVALELVPDLDQYGAQEELVRKLELLCAHRNAFLGDTDYKYNWFGKLPNYTNSAQALLHWLDSHLSNANSLQEYNIDVAARQLYHTKLQVNYKQYLLLHHAVLEKLQQLPKLSSNPVPTITEIKTTDEAVIVDQINQPISFQLYSGINGVKLLMTVASPAQVIDEGEMGYCDASRQRFILLDLSTQYQKDLFAQHYQMLQSVGAQVQYSGRSTIAQMYSHARLSGYCLTCDELASLNLVINRLRKQGETVKELSIINTNAIQLNCGYVYRVMTAYEFNGLEVKEDGVYKVDNHYFLVLNGYIGSLSVGYDLNLSDHAVLSAMQIYELFSVDTEVDIPAARLYIKKPILLPHGEIYCGEYTFATFAMLSEFCNHLDVLDPIVDYLQRQHSSTRIKIAYRDHHQVRYLVNQRNAQLAQQSAVAGSLPQHNILLNDIYLIRDLININLFGKSQEEQGAIYKTVQFAITFIDIVLNNQDRSALVKFDSRELDLSFLEQLLGYNEGVRRALENICLSGAESQISGRYLLPRSSFCCCWSNDKSQLTRVIEITSPRHLQQVQPVIVVGQDFFAYMGLDIWQLRRLCALMLAKMIIIPQISQSSTDDKATDEDRVSEGYHTPRSNLFADSALLSNDLFDGKADDRKLNKLLANIESGSEGEKRKESKGDRQRHDHRAMIIKLCKKIAGINFDENVLKRDAAPITINTLAASIQFLMSLEDFNFLVKMLSMYKSHCAANGNMPQRLLMQYYFGAEYTKLYLPSGQLANSQSVYFEGQYYRNKYSGTGGLVGDLTDDKSRNSGSVTTRDLVFATENIGYKYRFTQPGGSDAFDSSAQQSTEVYEFRFIHPLIRLLFSGAYLTAQSSSRAPNLSELAAKNASKLADLFYKLYKYQIDKNNHDHALTGLVNYYGGLNFHDDRFYASFSQDDVQIAPVPALQVAPSPPHLQGFNEKPSDVGSDVGSDVDSMDYPDRISSSSTMHQLSGVYVYQAGKRSPLDSEEEKEEQEP